MTDRREVSDVKRAVSQLPCEWCGAVEGAHGDAYVCLGPGVESDGLPTIPGTVYLPSRDAIVELVRLEPAPDHAAPDLYGPEEAAEYRHQANALHDKLQAIEKACLNPAFEIERDDPQWSAAYGLVDRLRVRSIAPDHAERVERFRVTTGALSGGNNHSDRCVCQQLETGPNADTPHVHRAEPPHACARCACEAYVPAVAHAERVEAAVREAKEALLMVPAAHDCGRVYELHGRHASDCPAHLMDAARAAIDALAELARGKR